MITDQLDQNKHNIFTQWFITFTIVLLKSIIYPTEQKNNGWSAEHEASWNVSSYLFRRSMFKQT